MASSDEDVMDLVEGKQEEEVHNYRNEVFAMEIITTKYKLWQ
jgi:hypothetical protein